MIAIMGATGNTGRKIVDALLRAGEPVRALGRAGAKLDELQQAGAEVVAGDTSDPAFLTGAFRGVDAAYTLLPTDRRAADYRGQQDVEGEAIAQAVRENRVPYLVALSSVGADSTAESGVIQGLRAQEQRLQQVAGTNFLFLRPVSFFENFYDQIPLIQMQGIIADSVTADLAIPMVASRDVAAAATDALQRRDWSGVVVRELIGERDLSYNDVTRIIGEQIGRPDLTYVQMSYDDTVGALVEAGLSESFARQYVAMTRAFNENTVKPLHGRTPQNTTATRFEDFAVELAAAYRAAQQLN